MKLSPSILIPLAVIALTIIAALEQLQPPSVVAANADPGIFSAERAMQYVRVITATPHPVGSVANAHVRDYLIVQLKSLGMDVSVQRTTAALAFGAARAVEVENIIAHRNGASSSKPVMFAAHYDSDPKAPGAGDNGYAVAGILEMLRALKFHPPLRNDLIVLFTDGEEAGLFGARAFVNEYPLPEKIGMVFNFDGRGNSGPALMFETTEQNGWLVREFSDAVRHEVAFSIMTDLYKLLPNNTDFTFFKEIVGSGMNFAHIGGVEYYHGVRDDAEHLSQRTLQDHGETMLDAALHFGNIDLKEEKRPDVVYFTFLWPRFIIYPLAWNIPLTVIATVLFFVVVFFAVRKKQLRVVRVLVAMALFLLRMAVAGGSIFLLWKYLGPMRPELGLLYLQTVYHATWFLAGFIALSLVIGLALHRFVVGKLGLFNVTFGALFVWLVTCWLASLYVPNGSYLFVWPFVFSVAAVAGALTLREKDESRTSVAGIVIVASCAVPGIYLYTQLIDLFFQGMTLFVAGVLAALVVFLLGTMQLLWASIALRRQWIEPCALFLVAVVCILIGLFRGDSAREFPKPDSIDYLYDADTQVARWATFDEKMDAWTSQFFSGSRDTVLLRQFFPFATDRFVTSPASKARPETPAVQILADKVMDTLRTLKLEIRSQENSVEMAIFTDSSDIVYGARVNGKAIEDAAKYIPQISRFVPKQSQPWSLYFFGRRCELDLSAAAHRPLHLRIVTRSTGIPEEAMRGLNPRPDWTISRPFYPTDMTIVGKTFSF